MRIIWNYRKNLTEKNRLTIRKDRKRSCASKPKVQLRFLLCMIRSSDRIAAFWDGEPVPYGKNRGSVHQTYNGDVGAIIDRPRRISSVYIKISGEFVSIWDGRLVPYGKNRRSVHQTYNGDVGATIGRPRRISSVFIRIFGNSQQFSGEHSSTLRRNLIISVFRYTSGANSRRMALPARRGHDSLAHCSRVIGRHFSKVRMKSSVISSTALFP